MYNFIVSYQTPSPQPIRGTIYPLVLIASAVAGLLALSGSLLSTPSTREATMYIEPSNLSVKPGETFTINVTVVSNLPVNAFAGKIVFDRTVLVVEKIDYNTSIADLWAQEPWYNEGDGTLSFIGGTTKGGGFTGAGSLITVTFKAKGLGNANMWLVDSRILQHDGKGTEAPMALPIDSVFTVIPNELVNVSTKDASIDIKVQPQFQNTDLSGDGTTSLGDISIFMVHLATTNLRSDFNNDGKVNTVDLSILLNART